jgi:hypothetical protein
MSDETPELIEEIDDTTEALMQSGSSGGVYDEADD